HNNINISGQSFFFQPVSPHGNAIIVSMSDHNMVAPNLEFLFSGKIRKEVIISANHMDRAARQSFYIVLMPFNIPQMNKSIHWSHLLYYFFQVYLMAMSIADY